MSTPSTETQDQQSSTKPETKQDKLDKLRADGEGMAPEADTAEQPASNPDESGARKARSKTSRD